MKRMFLVLTGLLMVIGASLSAAGKEDGEVVLGPANNVPTAGEADGETVFGPARYVRMTGEPDVYIDSFEASDGRQATVVITNGNGKTRVSSGVITLNGKQLFEPDDFRKQAATLQAEVELKRTNDLQVELRGKPSSVITLEVLAAHFFEEIPMWRMPDLGLTGLEVDPDRTDPGAPVTMRATVKSLQSGTAGGAELRFLVDGMAVCSSAVEPLAPGTGIEVECLWTPDTPGRFSVEAELVMDEDATDYESNNNRALGLVRVSGETDPLPEMVLQPEFDQMDIVPGEPFNFTVTARNPSFTEVPVIPLSFLVDGELFETVMVEDLAPGEERALSFEWDCAEPGRHMVQFRPEDPDEPPLELHQYPVLTVDLIIMYKPKPLYQSMQKDKWVSMGPEEIAGGAGLPGGSVGRVDAIAFDPYDPSKMYAAPYRGGLWKTGNVGMGWRPMTDGLPTLLRGAVAIHPKSSNVLYYGTGYFGGGERGLGIFKSVDGGVNWSHFASKVDTGLANPVPIKVVEKLVVRQTASGVLIYAATDLGVLRYKGTDIWDLVSTPSEWTVIKSGKIWDMAVNPDNDSEIYASVFLPGTITSGAGLWRTTTGEAATGDSAWTEILGRNGSPGHFELDVFWDQPKTVWAALDKPGSGCNGTLAVFKSVSGGAFNQRYCFDLEGLNEFIRVHPTDPDEIYFGAVNLYWCKDDCGGGDMIKGVHADQKEFQWEPMNSTVFWVTNDGGIFRCERQETTSGNWDYDCKPKNRDLRVTQFYDFDTSRTDPELMIGGTQDNGTIMFPGHVHKPDLWDWIKGGDGYYAVITPDNSMFYGQQQRLNDTMSCDDGRDCGPGDWKVASQGLPGGDVWAFYNSQIVSHPGNSIVLLGIGPEAHATSNAGSSWVGIGPTAADGLSPDSTIVRIAAHPQGPIFAGTNKGEIWAHDLFHGWTKLSLSPWDANLNHRVWSMALSPADPDYLYVLFAHNNPGLTMLRMLRLHIDPETLSVEATPIAHNFPVRDDKTTLPVIARDIRVIAGDGHDVDVVYVGTDKGVFKGQATCDGCKWIWTDYSDGLPLVEIYDLLVDPTSKELRAASFGRGAWRVITGP